MQREGGRSEAEPPSDAPRRGCRTRRRSHGRPRGERTPERGSLAEPVPRNPTGFGLKWRGARVAGRLPVDGVPSAKSPRRPARRRGDERRESAAGDARTTRPAISNAAQGKYEGRSTKDEGGRRRGAGNNGEAAPSPLRPARVGGNAPPFPPFVLRHSYFIGNIFFRPRPCRKAEAALPHLAHAGLQEPYEVSGIFVFFASLFPLC